MRKKHIFFILFLVILFSFSVLSCSETSGTGSLKLILQQNNSKTIAPQSSAERVVKYNVFGTGPGSQTFSKDTSSKTVVIEGLSNGQWEIRASGITNDGNIITTGEKNINFSGSSSSEVIPMNVNIGNGTCKLTVDWDSTVTKPSVAFEINGIGSDFKFNQLFEVKEGSTSYEASFKDIPSGYYTIKTTVFNGDMKVISKIDALHIVNAVATEGEISLKTTSEVPSENTVIELATTDGFNLSGSIEELADFLVSDRNYTINFIPSANAVTSDLIYINWYIDGDEVSSEIFSKSQDNKLDFQANKGRHIINCICTDSYANTCAAAEFRYTGASEDPKGTAILSTTIRPGNTAKINLDSSTSVGLLPDGKIVILSPQSGTLQLCSVCSTGLLPETDGTYSANMENFGFILNAQEMYTDAETEYFAVKDSGKNLNIIKYNNKKNILAPAVRPADDSVVVYSETYPYASIKFGNLSAAAVYRKPDRQASFLFTAYDNGNLFSVGTIPEGIAADNLSFLDDDFYNCTIISAFDDRIIYCSDNNLLVASFDGDIPDSLWYKADVEIDNPKKILFVNSDNFLVEEQNVIRRFHINNFKYYTHVGDVRLDSTDIALTPDCAYMYACNSDGELYSYATDYVGNFKRLYVCETDGNFKQVVANNDYVVAVSEDGSLYIFEIAEGE